MSATLHPSRPETSRGERMVLNLFFEEKDDRWFRGDRHLRTWLRRLLLGKPWINGQQRVFLNLCAGLDKLGIRYRVNDYGYIRKHPDELACVIGRPFVLDWIDWKNPILLGVASYNHPIDDPDLLTRYPVKHIVVPCQWYADMCRPGWPNIDAWPVGIDTDAWTPPVAERKSVDVLLYDKVLWDRDRIEPDLIEPIRARLRAEGRTFEEIRYGSYNEQDYRAALARCRTMIFLSQNESQGIACLQALASGVPVLAWDRGGPWRDPDYFPHRVRFDGVSSVPYWDDRCGMKFVDAEGFSSRWSEFWTQAGTGDFQPRQYVLDNLTLEKGALHYYEIAQAVMQRLSAR
ncbi:glycosyltransferase [Bradyrhizobium sp. CCGUVB23]|uniref:glycosyltransferase n=1 Tax=Bradyrhizobium sp. CCGUVB23 TaxID=2949630 RepID=UPI0020B2DA20|nr:glycosyltransferase [Bradyrhizobium sp. CCGUVB23]MCP3460205.1 glycosyltransferase [Bradyrhizobium sp. CCGUVB23]